MSKWMGKYLLAEHMEAFFALLLDQFAMGTKAKSGEIVESPLTGDFGLTMWCLEEAWKILKEQKGCDTDLPSPFEMRRLDNYRRAVLD